GPPAGLRDQILVRRPSAAPRRRHASKVQGSRSKNPDLRLSTFDLLASAEHGDERASQAGGLAGDTAVERVDRETRRRGHAHDIGDGVDRLAGGELLRLAAALDAVADVHRALADLVATLGAEAEAGHRHLRRRLERGEDVLGDRARLEDEARARP